MSLFGLRASSIRFYSLCWFMHSDIQLLTNNVKRTDYDDEISTRINRINRIKRNQDKNLRYALTSNFE